MIKQVKDDLTQLTLYKPWEGMQEGEIILNFKIKLTRSGERGKARAITNELIEANTLSQKMFMVGDMKELENKYLKQLTTNMHGGW